MSNESLNYDMVTVSKYFSKTTKRGIVLAKELGEGLVTSKVLLTGMLKAANEVSPSGIPAEVVNRIESHTLKELQVESHTLKELQVESHTLKELQAESHTLKELQANNYGYEADGGEFVLTPAAEQALVDSRKHSLKQEVSFVAAHHVVLALLQQEAVRYYLNGVCKVNAQKLERSLRGARGGRTLQDFEGLGW